MPTSEVVLTANQIATIESGDKTIFRWPVQPQPLLGTDQLWHWGNESWNREETYITTRAKTGLAIGWLCPLINRGQIRVRGVGHPQASAVEMVGCMIQRLITDLDVDDELLGEGYTGDDAVQQHFRDWDDRWGKTVYRYSKNPWVWRVRFRILSREIDGREAGRGRVGAPASPMLRSKIVKTPAS